MDSPPDSPSSFLSDSSHSHRFTARSSLVDSFRSCRLSGIRIDREDLKRRVLIPEYLRLAMRDSIRLKDPTAGESYAWDGKSDLPEAPMIVFVNSKSGGRLGSILKGRLQDLISNEQVFDLSDVKPPEFVHYGLACLEHLGSLGDCFARQIREKLRVVVAGGDGTVGWVLGSLQELYCQSREPVPPTGIIPLGTGNDLSRSFGWGGSFPFAWRSAVKRSLYRAITGSLSHLDSWHVTVSTPSDEVLELPYSLHHTDDCTLAQDWDIYGYSHNSYTCFEGVFYNYYSIGMDAQVAYGFHHLRDEKPYLAQGPIANKLIYSGYSCTQGWFCTPCMSDPSLRGLKNILRVQIKKVNCSEWEEIRVPSSVRAIVALNLHHYGSGRNPWGNLKPDYLKKRGFVEAQSDDGLLEIFGLKQGWHASLVMVELISAKHIAQAAAVRFEIRGGEWKQAFMQMDGEPWRQPLDTESSTFVEIKRVTHQSIMISGE